MNEHGWLAERFEAHRPHLRAVAYRMLGSQSEVDDAVQESWIRLSRSDTSGVENLGGWLTTVVARVSLDMLRSRASRREEPMDDDLPEQIVSPAEGIDPEREALLADSIGPALLVVLDTLAPAERLAFVLHDMFAVPFDEVAPILGRSPNAAKQLASRARRRVQGVEPGPDADLSRQRQIVDAFLAASRNGDFDALLALLDPDVVLRADARATPALRRLDSATPIVMIPGGSSETRGAPAVAGTFARRGNTAQLALINGVAGSVWAPGGRPRVAFSFTIAGGKIVGIDMIGEPEHLQGLDVTILDK